MLHFDKYNKRLNGLSDDEIMYMQFESLSAQGVLVHRVFTRLGGVSQNPFDSLNVSFSVGDDAHRVEKNLQIIKNNMGANRLLFMNQVHETGIISLKKGKNKPVHSGSKGDAMITDIPYTALVVKQADCQGIILFDRVKKVISVIHSGWRGSTQNIINKTVKRMLKEYECDPSDILAAIGPSLGPCCAEFISYEEIFPPSFQAFMSGPNHFDLWRLSIHQLLESGIRRENIETSGICTKCNSALFYSYRAHSVTGRFATAAMIAD